MDNAVLTKLKSTLGDMTKSQRKVAEYVLSEPMQAAFSTIEQISRATNASTATVIRLAHFLGFDRFVEFQRALQENIQQSMAPSSRLEARFRDTHPLDTMLSDILSIQLANLQTVIDTLDDVTVNQIADKICSAGKIYVCGARSCYGIAHYLAYNLNRVTAKADFLDPFDGMIAEKLMRIAPHDVFIGISYPRYITNVVKSAAAAKKCGAYTVAISDSPASPLSEHCDICLNARCSSYDFHNSTLAASLIAEVLISLVTTRTAPDAQAALKASEEIMRSFNIHANYR